jgi:hypothetical protein
VRLLYIEFDLFASRAVSGATVARPAVVPSAIGNRLIRLSCCLEIVLFAFRAVWGASDALSKPAQAISTTAVYPDASQLWAIPFSQVTAQAVLWF